MVISVVNGNIQPDILTPWSSLASQVTACGQKKRQNLFSGPWECRGWHCILWAQQDNCVFQLTPPSDGKTLMSQRGKRCWMYGSCGELRSHGAVMVGGNVFVLKLVTAAERADWGWLPCFQHPSVWGSSPRFTHNSSSCRRGRAPKD